MKRSIVVHIPDTQPYIFRGDIDADVSGDGILTIVDYGQRASGENNGLVFAASAGKWSFFCISPFVELKEAAA